MEDWLTQLPDDVLGIILSLLDVKEAVRTSTLSRRWEYVWTLFSGCLDFDYSDVACELGFLRPGPGTVDVARQNFLNRVNRVMEWHQGPAIDGLRISFDLDVESSRCDIDRWVKFAMDKRVKKFCLDLTCSHGYIRRKRYTFPKHSLSLSNFNSLTSLSMKNVDVTGEVIESFLCKCPLLEELSVVESTCIGNLQISGPSLKLRHLEIIPRQVSANIEISASKLVSFKYGGAPISMTLKYVPALKVARFGTKYSLFLVRNFEQLSVILLQLDTLALDFWPLTYPMTLPRFPTTTNLKQLELKLNVIDRDTLFSCASLIRSFPLLHRFALQLCWHGKPIERGQRILKANKHPHLCLKVVEFVGFVGYLLDIEFARYLLKNAVTLERLSIDPRLPCRLDFMTTQEKNVVRERARELESELSPGAEFVIL
ncbi:hypothetical protein Vadar_027002 [Vaccinium darrowii]|uniref:Uncharacterized protein n=1 Tax=Vaccinium darrowii TaxID=229202 RepID=A0ACB7YG61_9ERIC|nr:hypothetical protein Vadar_027002 [Vaccinium darrowii]